METESPLIYGRTSGARRAATAGLAVMVAVLLLPVLGSSPGASGSAPSGDAASPQAVANFTGACTLLPGMLPVLANGTDSQTFTWSVQTGVGLPSNTTGLTVVNASLTRIYTVGEARGAWSAICTNPAFVGAYQNTSPSDFGLQAAYSIEIVPGGTADVENLTLSPEFTWSAACTVDEPYMGAVNLSGPPPYTGAGCGFQEFWSIFFEPNGNLTEFGPLLVESNRSGATTRGVGGGGPPSPPGFTPSVVRSWGGAVTVAALVGGAGVALVMARSQRTRSDLPGKRDRWPPARPPGSAPPVGREAAVAGPAPGPDDSLGDLL